MACPADISDIDTPTNEFVRFFSRSASCIRGHFGFIVKKLQHSESTAVLGKMLGIVEWGPVPQDLLKEPLELSELDFTHSFATLDMA